MRSTVRGVVSDFQAYQRSVDKTKTVHAILEMVSQRNAVPAAVLCEAPDLHLEQLLTDRPRARDRVRVSRCQAARDGRILVASPVQSHDRMRHGGLHERFQEVPDARAISFDLAVGIVIGLAFAAIVTALVADPDHSADRGDEPEAADYAGLHVTVNHGRRSSTARSSTPVVSFMIIAAVIFFVIGVPMNRVTASTTRKEAATTKECRECLEHDPDRPSVGARTAPPCRSTGPHHRPPTCRSSARAGAARTRVSRYLASGSRSTAATVIGNVTDIAPNTSRLALAAAAVTAAIDLVGECAGQCTSTSSCWKKTSSGR